MPAPTPSVEDYIKGIFKLQSAGMKVTTSALAKQLGIGDGSVTDMVKKLSEKKFIQYTPYHGVRLTEAGKRLALKTVRRHRLWEMFLVQFLGYSWDEIHNEAERLEHITSDEMERRLDRALGYPKVDPHGDPIPSADGELHARACTALHECRVGDKVEVLRVSDDDPALLQHAAKLGLALHVKIFIKEKLSFDGSMKVKVGTKEHFISRQLAEAIFVKAV